MGLRRGTQSIGPGVFGDYPAFTLYLERENGGNDSREGGDGAMRAVRMYELRG